MFQMRHLVFWFVALASVFIVATSVFNLACFISTQEVFRGTLNIVAGTDSVNSVLKEKGSFFYPAIWNGLLISIFVLQHTGMASVFWKSILTDFNLQILSRAFYAISTSLVIQTIIHYWQPFPSVSAVWYLDTTDRPGMWLFFFIIHVLAWIAIYFSSIMLDVLELVGLKQVYFDYIGLKDPVTYKTQAEQKLLNHMCHPGTTCLLIVLWIHPLMTLQRFFLSCALTLYLLFGFAVSGKDYEYVRHQVYHKRVIITHVDSAKLS